MAPWDASGQLQQPLPGETQQQDDHDMLDEVESFEANSYQNRCLEAFTKKKKILYLALHGQPTYVYGMDRRDSVCTVRKPSPQADRTPEEWARMLRHQQQLREQNRSLHARSRSHFLNPRSTPQSDRVDRYNTRLGIQIHPEWQTHWRGRVRRSPPRSHHDMEINLAQWRANEAHVLRIRILDTPPIGTWAARAAPDGLGAAHSRKTPKGSAQSLCRL